MKLTKKLAKEILELSTKLQELKCQKFNAPGQCRNSLAFPKDFCPACVIRENAAILKDAAERFNPNQVIF